MRAVSVDRAQDVIVLISWLSRLDDAELDLRGHLLLGVLVDGLRAAQVDGPARRDRGVARAGGPVTGSRPAWATTATGPQRHVDAPSPPGGMMLADHPSESGVRMTPRSTSETASAMTSTASGAVRGGPAARTVSDAERRARLGTRHALAAGVRDVAAAARAVVCLHATEASSVHLSAWARSAASRADVEAALYRDRSIVKQLAMRRTVFAVPTDLLPAVRVSAAARVAAQQHALLARSVVAGGLAEDGGAWVDQACAQVLDRLRQAPASTRTLREELPVLTCRLPRPESPGAAPSPVAPRVMTVLAASGRVVRGVNEGSWTTSRPVWTTVEDWVGLAVEEPGRAVVEAQGYAELVRRWLWAYGPGTEADLVWWLGATKAAVRTALVEVGAVAVQLQDDAPAWLHPEDLEPVEAPPAWAALLPVLDPTTMGWRGRRFHLEGVTAAEVYDRAGNGSPTAWWDGRVVGRWAQRQDGRVVVLPLVELPREATAALTRRADLLTQWLDGEIIRSSFQAPLLV